VREKVGENEVSEKNNFKNRFFFRHQNSPPGPSLVRAAAPRCPVILIIECYKQF